MFFFSSPLMLLVALQHKRKRDKQLNGPNILQHCLSSVYQNPSLHACVEELEEEEEEDAKQSFCHLSLSEQNRADGHTPDSNRKIYCQINSPWTNLPPGRQFNAETVSGHQYV